MANRSCIEELDEKVVGQGDLPAEQKGTQLTETAGQRSRPEAFPRPVGPPPAARLDRVVALSNGDTIAWRDAADRSGAAHIGRRISSGQRHIDRRQI
jgi:hypothetical protein